MRRRDFIKVITGSAAVWPLAARAQQREQKRRVAVLMGGLLSGDFGAQAEAAALEAGLTELGWKLGSNIELEYRWPGAELDQVSIAANEIVAMRPDLVVSRSTPTTAIMMNRGLPIVFVLVTDPLFSGRIHHTLIYINAEPLPHEYQAVIWRISPTTCRADRHFDARSRGFGG